MNRGEVWRVNFAPSVGGALHKLRPAVIVSHDAANRNLNRVQAVPITRGVQKLYPREAYVTLNGEPHKAAADQIMTASKARFGDRPDTDPKVE